MDEQPILPKQAPLGLVWLADNLKRIDKMCVHINRAYSDELMAYCIDIVPEIFDSFDISRAVPLDRYLLSILRKRCVAWCVKRRKVSSVLEESLPFNSFTALPTHDYEDREFLLILIGRLHPPLTEMETKLLWSYIVDGMTFGEISETLTNTSETSVRREYWQIFWRLRKLA